MVKKEVQVVERRRLRDVLLVKKPLAIVFLVVFFILVIIVLNSFFGGFLEEIYDKTPTCGDGSFYDTCSLTEPYYCIQGDLIEKSSICGCPEGFVKKENSCSSNYHVEEKQIVFDYVLRGKEDQIKFVVYKGFVDYLTTIPPFLSYGGQEVPSRTDFKLKHLNEEKQRVMLNELVIAIQNITPVKEDQLRIAISLVQNIDFEETNKTFIFLKQELNYSRYPYEVIYEGKGVCGEKSELLAYLLREMGYGVVLFYNQLENHESVGIKCPARYDWRDTGYCFVETSGPAIITDDEIEFVDGVKILSNPQVMLISEGLSLGSNLYEYKDAAEFKKIRKSLNGNGNLGSTESESLEKLSKKYGLIEIYNL